MTTATQDPAEQDVLHAALTHDGSTPDMEQQPAPQPTNDEDEESEADRLMAMGFAAAREGKSIPQDELPQAKEPKDEQTQAADQPNEPAAAPAPAPVDPATLLEQRMAALEKGSQTLAGHFGHIKQQLARKSEAKPITAESLKRMSEEFGPEYAAAVAHDLNELGFGGQTAISQEEIAQRIQEQVQERAEAIRQESQKEVVLTVHPDADDYFAGGPHNAAFGQWVSTLPTERQTEIATSWRASVVSKYLTEFKDSQAKANKQQARQESRIQRGIVPTSGAAAQVAPPIEDPMEVGWRNVHGNRKGRFGR